MSQIELVICLQIPEGHPYTAEAILGVRSCTSGNDGSGKRQVLRGASKQGV